MICVILTADAFIIYTRFRPKEYGIRLHYLSLVVVVVVVVVVVL